VFNGHLFLSLFTINGIRTSWCSTLSVVEVSCFQAKQKISNIIITNDTKISSTTKI